MQDRLAAEKARQERDQKLAAERALIEEQERKKKLEEDERDRQVLL